MKNAMRVLKEALNKQEIISDVSFEAVSNELKSKLVTRQNLKHFQRKLTSKLWIKSL